MQMSFRGATVHWQEVMKEDDLWTGDMLGEEVEDVKGLLVNVEGEVHAYKDRCPHKATPLSNGELEDTHLTCATHRWEFSVVAGHGLNPTTSQLTVFPVRVEDGVILVGLPESA
jgi:toluene monooxygenase system ferredoxin subunit